MSEGMSRRERWAAADAQAAQARWGMNCIPDTRIATPERLAYEAYERGDQLFQIDLAVSVVQGTVNALVGYSRTVRPEYLDHLGAIEAQGWRLEHVSTTFVHQGQSTMGALGGAAETASHGMLMGLYVFRRASRAETTG